jgi:hypothetical protein
MTVGPFSSVPAPPAPPTIDRDVVPGDDAVEEADEKVNDFCFGLSRRSQILPPNSFLSAVPNAAPVEAVFRRCGLFTFVIALGVPAAEAVDAVGVAGFNSFNA